MTNINQCDGALLNRDLLGLYADNKDESVVSHVALVTRYGLSKANVLEKLNEANNQLMEGLSLGGEVAAGSKDHVRRRQLQAKMVMELMEIDNVQGKECLRLWKEMSDVFVQIRDMKFAVMDDYLRFRAVDAGCP